MPDIAAHSGINPLQSEVALLRARLGQSPDALGSSPRATYS